MVAAKDLHRGFTHDYISSLLRYDEESGWFYWKISRSRGIKIGQRAGTKRTEGYRSIEIDGISFLEHRLAWFLVKRFWPPDRIDHKNLQKDDNKFLNLRLATHSQNLSNAPIYKNNTSGFKGVSFNSSIGLWCAYITIDQKRRYLGNFDRSDDAARAYDVEAKKLFGEFARINFSS